MDIHITPRHTRNGKKIYYTLSWGKKPGQRLATGIFTYTNPINRVQKEYNKEAFCQVEIRKAKLLLEWQSLGSNILARQKYTPNFIEFYADYVAQNAQQGNRHLAGSFRHFCTFIRATYVSPSDITEDLAKRFQKYLLDRYNGETPANYFARFKQALKAATRQGYFRANPCEYIPVKVNKNKIRKNHLEAEEYIHLLKTPCANEEVRDAFIFCCYTGLRWCDINTLVWRDLKNTDTIIIVQNKTQVENVIFLHHIARTILNNRKVRCLWPINAERVFNLPTPNGANKILDRWCAAAGIKKHITWHSARLSFSVLLQDANIDATTVSLLLGHTSTKYVNQTYRRYRPKDLSAVINKLPDPNSAPPIKYHSLVQ
jgi:integrase